MSEKSEADLLSKLLDAYGEAVDIQDAQESLTDSQLNCVSLMVEDIVNEAPMGTILDIGCGKGVLLPRLASSASFRDNSNWLYLGADFSHLHEDILQLAISFKLHRRCEVITLDTLYSSWTKSVDINSPLVIFIRNVFHELDIDDTARLLHSLNLYMTSKDFIIVQDLLVFPSSERGNVCWDSECLENVFNRIGFRAVFATYKSKSGAQWLSSKGNKSSQSKVLSLEEIKHIVAEERLSQYKKWMSIDLLPDDIRIKKVAHIDFDLQTRSLTNQLINIGYISLSPKEGIRNLNCSDAFEMALMSYDNSILDRDALQLPLLANFRDRATSQDAFENFLQSKDSIVIIQGGSRCGKTALVAHVLSRRAHRRSIVPIDCEATRDVWPIIEQYLLSIGCKTSIEVLSHEKNFTFTAVHDSITKLSNDISGKSIIVFDHFEKLLDPRGQILDPEIRQFLDIISSNESAKVVITTRKFPILDFLSDHVAINAEQPPVGRKRQITDWRTPGPAT